MCRVSHLWGLAGRQAGQMPDRLADPRLRRDLRERPREEGDIRLPAADMAYLRAPVGRFGFLFRVRHRADQNRRGKTKSPAPSSTSKAMPSSSRRAR